MCWLRQWVAKMRIWALLVLWVCSGAVFSVSLSWSGTSPTVVEDHSEALCQWYRSGVNSAILLHFDAHDDFFSKLVTISASDATIRAALETQSCAELQPRVSHQIQSDALYGIADFIYPAWRLGVISEVWWVVPEEKPLSAQWLKDFLVKRKDQYPEAFLASLTLKKQGHVEGVLQQMPVRILTVQQLPAFEKPVLLDIDIDYFVEMYQTPLQREMITVVGDFLRQWHQRKIPVEQVSISVSSNGGYTPVRFRYLADWLRLAFTDLGAMAKSGPPDDWKLQSGVERADYLLDRSEAHRLNDRLAKLQSASGLPEYNRAWMAAQQGDLALAMHAQDRAVKKDRRYLLGYQELAGKFMQLGQPEAAEELLKRSIAVEPQRASTYTQLGSLLIDDGRFREAVKIFDSAIDRLPKIAVLHAGKAFALAQLGEKDAARLAFAEFSRLAQPGTNTDAVKQVWQQLGR